MRVSWLLYLALMRGVWMMSRLVPVTVTAVWPLKQRDKVKGQVRRLWQMGMIFHSLDMCKSLNYLFWRDAYPKLFNSEFLLKVHGFDRWELCCVYLPVNAPLWFNLGDGGILHILKAQVFLEMSLVYAHRHRNVPVAVQRCVGPAGEPLTTPPNVMTEQWKFSLCIL